MQTPQVRQLIEAADFPATPGAYVVYGSESDEVPLYVGVAAAQTIQQRWRQHLALRSGGSALRRSLAVWLGLVTEKLKRPARYYSESVEEDVTRSLQTCWIQLFPAETGGEAIDLEHRLIRELKPLLNIRH